MRLYFPWQEDDLLTEKIMWDTREERARERDEREKKEKELADQRELDKIFNSPSPAKPVSISQPTHYDEQYWIDNKEYIIHQIELDSIRRKRGRY